MRMGHMLGGIMQRFKVRLESLIHNKIFWLGCIFVGTSLFFLLGVNGYGEAYRIKTENVFAERKVISILASDRVHDKIDYLLNLGVSFASRPLLLQGVTAGDWVQAINVLSLLPRYFPFIDQVILFDAKGTLKSQVPAAVQIPVSNEPHDYKNFIKERKPYISGVYQRNQEPHNNVVSVVIPVVTEPEGSKNSDVDSVSYSTMASILELQINVDFIASGLQISADKLGLFAYVVDQHGQLVFHSGLLGKDYLKDASVGPVVSQLLLGLNGVGVYEHAGIKEARVEAFSTVPGHGWGVVIAQPVVKAFAKRDRELQGLAWGYFLCVLLLVLAMGLVGFYVTERRRSRRSLEHLNDELQQQARSLLSSNKELEQFAYVASHDLQEPLRMVASFTQLLARKYKDKIDDQGRTYIDFITDGALRMQNLIEDLLVFSRCGQTDALREPVDLEQICRQILKDVIVASEAQHAAITWDSLPVIKANKVQMTHLFLNLITNALKYHSEKPVVIRITAQVIKPHVWQFSVADNGIGIDPKDFNKLFVIFQRLHSRESYEGTGIGLALCKKIVENYKGSIWLESALGQGSTFYFTLQEQEDT
jgi:signal transduction histidine kinase